MVRLNRRQLKPDRLRCHRGFTLIEVLVALTIAAIALAAVSRSIIQAIDITAALRDRQLALWVAQNQLARIRITRSWPKPDTTDGSATQMGREWVWKQKVITTPEPNFRRIEIEVFKKDESHRHARLVGFARFPARAK
ncbi:MAG: type II secretion system minor pseudopilin GspI [Acidiferrobacterales bacterium]